MDHWLNGQDPGVEDTGALPSLATVNVQTLPAAGQSEQPDDEPQSSGQTSSRVDLVERGYTVPPNYLASIGQRDLSRRNHAFRRLRRRFELTIRYQQRPEYWRYRDRPRKDTDEFGNIIWTKEMEESFSNGERLAGTPRASETPEPELYDYYNDSVADMVRNWPTLRNLLMNSSAGDQKTVIMPPVLKSNDSFADRHPLNQLEFEMWIGPSANVDRCLHKYTTTSSNDALFGRAINTLDGVKDWHYRYPDLEPILSGLSAIDSCDIVLVDACLQMMTNFPLEQVKLGINFQLGFIDAECSGIHGSGCLESFSCITRIYRQGKCVRQTEVDHCQVTGRGMVKPPFESGWWAQEFVCLTDTHHMAEDSGNIANITAADESSKQFFKDLTIMQQIFTGSRRSQDYPETVSIPERQRAALLLWKFSQAEPGQAALTVPYKIVLPMNRATSTTSIPLEDPNMSSFVTDTNTSARGLLENPYNTLSDSDSHLTQQYSSDMEELCQDGFMMLAQRTNPDFGSRAIIATNTVNGDVSNRRNIYDYPTSRSLCPQYPMVGIPHQEEIENLHCRDIYTQQDYGHDDIDASREMMHFATGEIDAFQIGRRRKALDHFDANTHEILQAQIGNTDALSGVNDKGDRSRQLHEQGLSNSIIKSDPEVIDAIIQPMPLNGKNEVPANVLWDDFDLTANLSDHASLTTRPLLQHGHSFAGVLHAVENNLETPRRSFKRLLDQVGLSQCSTFAQPSDSTSIGYGELGRSYSQPAPEVRPEHNDGQFQDLAVDDNDWQATKFEQLTGVD